MLVEESLLLRAVESTHFNSCQNVKAVADRILGVIEEFIPALKKSKVQKLSSKQYWPFHMGVVTN